MRSALALLVVAGLMASCDAGVTSEADQLHDLRVACLQGGGGWNTTTSACNGHVQATPTPRPLVDTRIAFESGRDGDYDIYVMDADGGNMQQLTDDPGGDRNPTWSPDGTQIAFSSGRNGYSDIYVMDADGGNVRNLPDAPGRIGFSPAWSPDGTRIAFASTHDGYSDIYVMDADGGNVQNLTDAPGTMESSPAWSPDGTRIAFESGRDGDYHIYVMDADGGNVLRLTNDARAYYHPSWSPA